MWEWLQQIAQPLLKIDALAILDIALVAIAIYWVLTILSGTRAMQVLRGGIIVAVFFVIGSSILPPTAQFLVKQALPAVILTIPIIFQPELRRALEQLGHTGDWLNRPLVHRSSDAVRVMVEEVASACVFLSGQHWGGLIVIERSTGLQDIARRGIPLDAVVTSQLLVNIFTYGTPLHDGAVVIRGDRIVAAAVVLPLAENFSGFGNGEPRGHGTRHRAAVGMTEQSDAIAIVVSEETGTISIAHDGRLISNLSADRLRRLLMSLLKLDGSARRSNQYLVRAKDLIGSNGHEGESGSTTAPSHNRRKTDTILPAESTEHSVNGSKTPLHKNGTGKAVSP